MVIIVFIFDGTRKSDEFLRNDPVKIAVFDVFVVSAFSGIKIVEIEKSKNACFVQGVETVFHGDFVGRQTYGSILKRTIPKLGWLERFVGQSRTRCLEGGKEKMSREGSGGRKIMQKNFLFVKKK